MRIFQTLADLAIATVKTAEANPTGYTAPIAPSRNLPANIPQPTLTPTAAETRARFERKLNTPALLPAPPGTAPQASGGPVNVSFVCAVTRKDFIFKFRENRYSARLYFQAAIKDVANSGGPAADPPRQFDLDSLEWSGAQCPHCATSFELGPVKCGACARFVCRGGANDLNNFFVCACGNAASLMGGLKTIDGAKSAVPIAAAQPAGPLLGASKPVPQLPAPPPLMLPKG